MTTQVTVLNRGPLAVKVSTLSVGPAVVDGMGNSVRTASEARVDCLIAGQHKDFSLYDSQEIRVSELGHV